MTSLSHSNNAIAALFSRQRANRVLVRRLDGKRKELYVVKYMSRQLVELLQRSFDELRALARKYPREFLRGFFDAEGHAAVKAGKMLSISVGADNCNLTFLRLVKRTLHTSFGMTGHLISGRPAGTLKVIRAQPFLTRQKSYILASRKIEDVRRFSCEIGFSITRKMEKLEDALLVYELHGPTKGAAEWKQVYTKRRGEWSKNSRADHLVSPARKTI
jgi:intein-encoded DNA endonuclease-like protein